MLRRVPSLQKCASRLGREFIMHRLCKRGRIISDATPALSVIYLAMRELELARGNISLHLVNDRD